jgi:hypothetical protein
VQVFFTRNGEFLGFTYASWLVGCTEVEGFAHLREEGDMLRFNLGDTLFATSSSILQSIVEMAQGSQMDAAMLDGVSLQQARARERVPVTNPLSTILRGKFSSEDSMALTDVQANLHGMQELYDAEIARIKRSHQEEKGIMKAKIRNLEVNTLTTSPPATLSRRSSFSGTYSGTPRSMAAGSAGGWGSKIPSAMGDDRLSSASSAWGEGAGSQAASDVSGSTAGGASRCTRTSLSLTQTDEEAAHRHVNFATELA